MITGGASWGLVGTPDASGVAVETDVQPDTASEIHSDTVFGGMVGGVVTSASKPWMLVTASDSDVDGGLGVISKGLGVVDVVL